MENKSDFLKPTFENYKVLITQSKAESTIADLDITKKNESSADHNEEDRSLNIHVFTKTGGPQPETWDAKAINKFFQGNLAKRWAMCDGYLPTYTGYENGEIQFELVTDSRCTGLYWISLCNYIANQFKEHVRLLKDATHFKAEHFIAKDIIGFNRKANDTDKLNQYIDRVQATYASLPLKPEAIHYGKIK